MAWKHFLNADKNVLQREKWNTLRYENTWFITERLTLVFPFNLVIFQKCFFESKVGLCCITFYTMCETIETFKWIQIFLYYVCGTGGGHVSGSHDLTSNRLILRVSATLSARSRLRASTKWVFFQCCQLVKCCSPDKSGRERWHCLLWYGQLLLAGCPLSWLPHPSAGSSPGLLPHVSALIANTIC